MKTDVHINIDTVEFSIFSDRNTFAIPNATTATVTNSDGEILDRYQNRKAISGKHGTHSLHARTLHSGSQLKIEGSPYANHYGQNIFTSFDMPKAVSMAINAVTENLGFQYSDEQKSRWISDGVELHRVDLAANFILQSEKECNIILKQLRRQLIEQHGTTRSSGTTVYWSPKNGKEYSIAIYAKGAQMRQLRRFDNFPSKSDIVRECARILRVEVRLRAPALKKLNLNKTSAWTDKSAQHAFAKYMRFLRIFSITSGAITDKELNSLPHRRLRPVLALHKHGCDLSMIYSESTLKRHLHDFRRLGIDLACPSQPAETTRSLTRILSPKRAAGCAPLWMQKDGLAPANEFVIDARVKRKRRNRFVMDGGVRLVQG